VEVVVVGIGDFAGRERAEKVPKQESPVRERIALDGNEALEARRVVVIEAGREAFPESAWTGEQIHDRVLFGLPHHSVDQPGCA